MATGALINTALYEHCPELVAACVARGDELVGHGHSNAERQAALDESGERELLSLCRSRIQEHSGTAPAGWLSPWISESAVTPDLLTETGYRYTLNWCHDDQPVRMRTRDGRGLWAVPYPQELNDIPMIVARQMDAKDFAQMIIDQFDEMLEQSRAAAAGDGHCAAPLPGGPALPPAPPAPGAGAHRGAARPRGRVVYDTRSDCHAHGHVGRCSAGRLCMSRRARTREDDIGAWVPQGRFIVEGRPGGPLAGLRFAAKDIFDVAGRATSAGNPTWLATHPVPARHSAVVAQLLDAGATLAGKVLTDELAYSLHGDNHHYGAPRNARAPSRVTGGSSSGSAAAVAARQVDFALGTDTGGSTRVPASYCGIWGLRTTHGLLSCAGLVPLHPSFDTVTWLARRRRGVRAGGHGAAAHQRISAAACALPGGCCGAGGC